jgi:hypothetical protein
VQDLITYPYNDTFNFSTSRFSSGKSCGLDRCFATAWPAFHCRNSGTTNDLANHKHPTRRGGTVPSGLPVQLPVPLIRFGHFGTQDASLRMDRLSALFAAESAKRRDKSI